MRIHPPISISVFDWTIRFRFRSGICLALIGAALGCSRTPPAEEKPPPAAVKWEGPLQGSLEGWTELAGTTMPLPDRIARISAPVEGRVVSILGNGGNSPIVEGQRVEKGAVLVQLDTTIVQAALDKAEAAQGVLQEEERQAQYAADWSASELKRLQKLKSEETQSGGTGTPLVTGVDLPKAEYALKDSQSKLKGASGRLAAGLKELASLRAQLKLHTLWSPIAGRIGRLQVVRGQTLHVGDNVAEVVDLDAQIDVLCYVPPSLVGRIKKGWRALTGGFDADTTAQATEAEGTVEYIAEQAEAETGNFALKVRFTNTESKLRANRVLRIRVLTTGAKECLSVKFGAVQEDEEKPTVVIVVDVKRVKNAEGKDETVGVARRLEATLGVRDHTLRQVEIVSLEDAEKDPAKKWKGAVKDALFVVEGSQGLQTGDAVKLEVEEE